MAVELNIPKCSKKIRANALSLVLVVYLSVRLVCAGQSFNCFFRNAKAKARLRLYMIFILTSVLDDGHRTSSHETPPDQCTHSDGSPRRR